MATITTRSGKGSPLTNSEVDSNFSNINTELSQKESASNKGVANGYASLDGSGKVPSTQLPSYVDDVVEGANLAALPATGETGKIYVTLDTNKTYRWSGSAYVEISASPGSTDAVTEGSTNLYFTNARARSAISASGSLSYNSSTGVLSYTQPTNVSALTNDSGYITSSALSPYLTSATAASTYQTALVSGTSIKTVNGQSVLGSGNIQIDGGVTSFNTRAGAVTLSSGDVTGALGYTPYNSTNPSGYITSSALSSYLPLSGGTVSGTLSVSSAYGAMAAAKGSYFGYSSGYGAVVLGSTASYQTTCIGVDPIGNPSGSFSGLGHEVMFRNGATFISPNASNNGFHTYLSLSGGVANFSAALQQSGNQVLNAGNYNSYAPTLTGSGASGTWGISISGTSAEVNSGRFSTTAGSYNNAYTWIQFGSSGGYGLYFPGSGAMTHFYPNSPSTYGSAYIEGVKNGYWGIMYGTSAGNAGWMTNTNTTGFYNHIHGWKYYHETGRFYSSSSTYGGGNTWSLGLYNTNNVSLYSGTTGAMGLLGADSGGSYKWQVYGDGSSYGFLQSAWGAWDLQKAVNGQLLIRVSGADYTALHSSNYSSYALPLSGGTVSGDITFSNGRKGLVGVYNPSQTQAIWAMGPSYVLTNGGGSATYGDFYGLGWSYDPNYGGSGNNPQSKNGLGHQLLLMWAGVTRTAIGTGIWTDGAITATGNVTAYSDERLKKDWSRIESGFVERLAVLQCGTYTRIDSGQRQAGVSAQNMREILPEVVSEDNDGTLALAYGNAALVSAVELAKELVALKHKVAELEARVH